MRSHFHRLPYLTLPSTSSPSTLRKMNFTFAFPSPLHLSSSSFAPPHHHSNHCKNKHVHTLHRQNSPYSSTSRRAPVKATLRPKIAVIGGGHAGLSTALRLSSLPWTRLTRPEITLIDKSDRFVFLPLLYDLSLSQVSKWEIAPKFSDLLQDNPLIKFEHANVDNLDLSSRAVEGTSMTDNSEFRLLFDKAIISVGAEVANLDKVEGAREFALPFYTLNNAIELKERLTELKKRSSDFMINIVVVGGGFSGVELASCVADDIGTRGSVMIVESGDRLLNQGTDFNRQTSLDTLNELNVGIMYNTRVKNVSADQVTTTVKSDGQDGTADPEMTFPADLVLWTAGNRPSQTQSAFGVPLNESGLVETNNYLQVKGHESELYALGDSAIGGGTAQIAVQQAEYAAWNCWADCVGGKPKLRWRYAALGEMMVLGKEKATVSTALKGADLSGKPAWVARRLAYLIRMPTERHRRMVAASWSMHPLLDGMGNLVQASRQYGM